VWRAAGRILLRAGGEAGTAPPFLRRRPVTGARPARRWPASCTASGTDAAPGSPPGVLRGPIHAPPPLPHSPGRALRPGCGRPASLLPSCAVVPAGLTATNGLALVAGWWHGRRAVPYSDTEWADTHRPILAQLLPIRWCRVRPSVSTRRPAWRRTLPIRRARRWPAAPASTITEGAAPPAAIAWGQRPLTPAPPRLAGLRSRDERTPSDPAGGDLAGRKAEAILAREDRCCNRPGGQDDLRGEVRPWPVRSHRLPLGVARGRRAARHGRYPQYLRRYVRYLHRHHPHPR
jgi:hypothetical protein